MSFYGVLSHFYGDMSPTMSQLHRRRLFWFWLKFGHDPIILVHQQLMILLTFMLSQMVSYLYASTICWSLYVQSLRRQYADIVWLHTLSTSASPLWPPDGILAAILVLFFILMVHFSILCLGILQLCLSKVYKFRGWFLKATPPLPKVVPPRQIFVSYALSSEDL